MYCAMSERRNHQPSQNVPTASNFDTNNKISATYSVLSHSLTTNLKSLPFYTLSKKQRTKWNNFLQWIDTSTNIFTIKCTGYHHLKQKLSKFSQFHAPQLLKKAEAFGLWPLPPTTQLILPTAKKHFLYAGTVMEVSWVQIL